MKQSTFFVLFLSTFGIIKLLYNIFALENLLYLIRVLGSTIIYNLPGLVKFTVEKLKHGFYLILKNTEIF